MNTKHTPGPWIAIPVKRPFHSSRRPIFEDGLWAILPEAHLERIPICEVDHADDHDPPTRLKAESDARLIAAAPELLNACKAAFADYVDVGGELTETDRLLMAAIAKAEGAE